MIRIVKSDASTVWSDGCGTLINIKDIVLIDKNWRPEDMADLCESECPESMSYHEGNCDDTDCAAQGCEFSKGFYAGFSACLEVLGRVKK